MAKTNNVVQMSDTPTLAVLTNVALAANALHHAMQRPPHLPGIVAMHGITGWGKTKAAVYVANKYRGHLVEVGRTWTTKKFLQSILIEMGVEPKRTNYDMVDQINHHLVLHNRPLIIDEFDHVVERKMVDVVRDIYDGSNAAIMIVGEERLENKLRQFQRFHNRILEWIPAQPCDMTDARQLVKLYCRGVQIDDALLEWIVNGCQKNTARICINLETARQKALRNNVSCVDPEIWGDEPLYNGYSIDRKV